MKTTINALQRAALARVAAYLAKNPTEPWCWETHGIVSQLMALARRDLVETQTTVATYDRKVNFGRCRINPGYSVSMGVRLTEAGRAALANTIPEKRT